MTKDEARTLLVEQGARIALALKECHEAVAVLYEHDEEIGRELSTDEQQECYLESCLLAGHDPEAAAEAVKDFAREDRLLTQLDNAPLN